jgi:ribosomal protein S18 acetylase RimI-like enzyme
MAGVRQLSVADAAAFRELRLAGLADEPRAFSADWSEEVQHDLDWFADRIASSAIFAISDETDSLLAITGLSIPTNPKQRHKGHIWGVYVRPEARGRGFATTLLAAAIAEALGRVEVLHLGVGTYNDAARGCYRAAGFVETGFEPRALRIGDDYFDEITMTLRLA